MQSLCVLVRVPQRERELETPQKVDIEVLSLKAEFALPLLGGCCLLLQFPVEWLRLIYIIEGDLICMKSTEFIPSNIRPTVEQMGTLDS